MRTEIIVVTGPESSGKTTLAEQLCDYWSAPLVPEVSREYLSDRASYQQHDLLEIAKQQYRREQSILSAMPEKIVCDTDLLVIMIWSEVKYGDCDPWIYRRFEDSIERQATDRYYCLCDYQIPWQADRLRENPHNRDELFELYRQKLREYDLAYSVITGTPKQRLDQVLQR